VTVVNLPVPEVMIMGFDLICPGETVLLTAGPEFTAYQWSDGSASGDLLVDAPGDYSVTVTDTEGCAGTDVFTIAGVAIPQAMNDEQLISPGDPRPITIDLIANDELPGQNDWELRLIDGPGTGMVAGLVQGELTFAPAEGFVGTITLTYVLCAPACPEACTEAMVNLIFLENELVEVPNAITPNGDGVNDAFVVDVLVGKNPASFPDNEFIVFNRWGDVVFRQQDYDNSWPGTNQAGEELPHGTYYFVLKLDLSRGLVIEGDVTIFRQ
jgi:gliding motility-associated-like protein